MSKNIIFKIIGKYSYFIWLIFLIFFTVFVTYFYNLNKKNQVSYLNKALKNTYLNNSIKKLTTNLKPRYINIEYNVKQGDTYESIINNLDIPNLEKKIFLNTITKDKNTKILNQTPEKVTAMKHSNGIWYWIISIEYQTNNFQLYISL